MVSYLFSNVYLPYYITTDTLYGNYIYKKVAFIALEGDHIVIMFFKFRTYSCIRSTHCHPCSLSLRE